MSISILENISLLKYNTFHIEATARYFVKINNEDEVKELLDSEIFQNNLKQGKVLVLGGGSNMLLTQNYDGLVVKNNLLWITSEDKIVSAAAGEDWDTFVRWTLDYKLYGLENLIKIPGTVWASPIQNIGAYWKEAKDFITQVHWYNLITWKKETLPHSECKFAYRDSVFKHELKWKFLVTQVDFQLDNSATYAPDLSYISRQLEKDGVSQDNIRAEEIAEYIDDVRMNKLPDPDETPNSGSFFKNPIIPLAQFEDAQKKYNNPEVTLKFFDIWNDNVKLMAAQLIDLAGFKNIEYKGVTVHPNQALVIINKSWNATWSDIVAYSQMIQKKVEDIFGIKIEPEVNFI